MNRIPNAQRALNLRNGSRVADRVGNVGRVTARVSATRVEVEFAHGTYVMYNSSLRYAA